MNLNTLYVGKYFIVTHRDLRYTSFLYLVLVIICINKLIVSGSKGLIYLSFAVYQPFAGLWKYNEAPLWVFHRSDKSIPTLCVRDDMYKVWKVSRYVNKKQKRKSTARNEALNPVLNNLVFISISFPGQT